MVTIENLVFLRCPPLFIFLNRLSDTSLFGAYKDPAIEKPTTNPKFNKIEKPKEPETEQQNFWVKWWNAPLGWIWKK